jgi:hypothetical protein
MDFSIDINSDLGKALSVGLRDPEKKFYPKKINRQHKRYRFKSKRYLGKQWFRFMEAAGFKRLNYAEVSKTLDAYKNLIK